MLLSLLLLLTCNVSYAFPPFASASTRSVPSGPTSSTQHTEAGLCDSQSLWQSGKSHIGNGSSPKSGQEIIGRIIPSVWIQQLISSAVKNVRIISSLESTPMKQLLINRERTSAAVPREAQLCVDRNFGKDRECWFGVVCRSFTAFPPLAAGLSWALLTGSNLICYPIYSIFLFSFLLV